MRTLSRSGAVAGVLAFTVAALAGCGLQDVGVQGVVTARNAGTGVDPGTGPGGAPLPGASTAPDGTVVDPTTGEPIGSGGFVGGGGTVGGGSGGVIGGGGTGGGTGGTGGTGGSGGTPQSTGLQGTAHLSYTAVTGFDQLSQIVNVSTASTGDPHAQVAALVKWVNAHGGIGGRRLVGHVNEYNAMQASTDNDLKLCNKVVSDDKSEAVVLHGQIHYQARACYKNAKVLAFEGGQYGWSQAFYNAHSPYLWAPSFSSYDEMLRAMVSSGARRAWFKNVQKVGIISWDDATYVQLRDQVLIPALKKIGYTDQTIVTAEISNADVGSMSSGMQTASSKMIQNGVTHLMFVGSNPLQPFYIQQAGHNGDFVYLLNSFDTPRYMAVSFADQMPGSIGVGANPVTDVLDAQWPFPQAGLEKTCVDIYKSEGVTIPARYAVKGDNDNGFDAKQALSSCELTLLYKHVADKLGSSFTAAQWSKAAERLGTSFQMALTFSTRLDSTHTGATSYRDLTFDAGCACMRYLQPARAFE